MCRCRKSQTIGYLCRSLLHHPGIRWSRGPAEVDQEYSFLSGIISGMFCRSCFGRLCQIPDCISRSYCRADKHWYSAHAGTPKSESRLNIWAHANHDQFPRSLHITTNELATVKHQVHEMLLVHQAGSVKVGELVRYTLTYVPSNDRILPTPDHLHLKIKNTSAIPLRAAWVHGPYALHVASYPSTFNPHQKQLPHDQEQYGVPEFEPMLKAGGSWHAKLSVPEAIRETGADLGKRRPSIQSKASGADHGPPSMTWIIEVTSQILFSNSASVHFEVLVGRDARSLDMGFAAVAGQGHGAPGQLKAQQTSEKERKRARKQGSVQTAGVYSKAVKLIVEDTETLWDKPALPTWDEKAKEEHKSAQDERGRVKRKKKIHLVIVTHGLHSNLGADMLFLKESIDATVAQTRKEAKQRRAEERKQETDRRETARTDENREMSVPNDDSTAPAPISGGQDDLNNATEDDDDEEETIVRGFTGNAVRTENGIQYLGKRLAKYVLRLTYPDQPFLPVKKSFSRTLSNTLKSEAGKAQREGKPSHAGSSIYHPRGTDQAELPYQFTSISFVGHSLGGLIQTYAMAYIHKHSPTFFQQIAPVNFIAMASPMLGLSNENPMYVKFALDFGLVGRTGQDLGLTWTPPTMAKSGWNAVISGFSSGSQKDQTKVEDPSAKPLLRILPTGPAHQVLRMFRNRTVYSNVVNDGIVPLRTSCLLFLDWRGLGKVDKARRENGLIGTVAEWGWAELTGASLSTLTPNVIAERYSLDSEEDEHIRRGQGDDVPQPDGDETAEDNRAHVGRASYDDDEVSKRPREGSAISATTSSRTNSTSQQSKGVLDNLLDFFRPAPSDQSPRTSKKTLKALHRAQTVHHEEEEIAGDEEEEQRTTNNPTMRPQIPRLKSNVRDGKRPLATRGESTSDANGEAQAPPKTSIFESAGDILHPPLPSKQWITDPSSRSRTIFHDRVYHPEDIPPPPAKRSGPRLTRSFSSDTSSKQSETLSQAVTSQQPADAGNMKVEEKIARAYHRDLSWRKVLVRLEPDAHNNMIVRRMFANAYGWPVVKHLTDTHFSGSYSARTRDEDEPARERAPPMSEPVAETGEEVRDQTAKTVAPRSQSERREAIDELAGLNVPRDGIVGSWSSRSGKTIERQSSAVWDDSYFEGSDGDSDDVDERTFISRMINPMAAPTKPEPVHDRPESHRSHDLPKTPTSNSFTDGHRGLTPVSPVKSIAATKPTFESTDVEIPVLAEDLVEEPSPLSPSTTADLGLQKSAALQFSPTKGKFSGPRTDNSGVAGGQ
nr:putative lipase [Quercus suber]